MREDCGLGESKEKEPPRKLHKLQLTNCAWEEFPEYCREKRESLSGPYVTTYQGQPLITGNEAHLKHNAL